MRPTALLVGALVFLVGCAKEPPVAKLAMPTPGDIRAEVTQGLATFRVLQPERWNERFLAETATLGPEDEGWHRYLMVLGVPRGTVPNPKIHPPVLGTYRFDQGDLVFTSRFPLSSEVVYHAVFDHTGTGACDANHCEIIRTSLELPTSQRVATTTLQQVYPTASVLPENQLKFYLHFSAAMSQGEAYRHVHLLKEDGEEVTFPFLELGEELWDATGKRFTLFFDPGRIKRGLKPREEMGPALEAGKRYTFVVDAGWRDAEGNPLQKEYRKSFQVGQPDDQQPDPKSWKLNSPAADTQGPLVVSSPKPLDHALLERLLLVTNAAGEKIPGKVAITDEEKRWQFVPDQPWSAEVKYELQVPTFLEDLAGNSIAKPFEVDVFETVDRGSKPEVLKLPIELSSP